MFYEITFFILWQQVAASITPFTDSDDMSDVELFTTELLSICSNLIRPSMISAWDTVQKVMNALLCLITSSVYTVSDLNIGFRLFCLPIFTVSCNSHFLNHSFPESDRTRIIGYIEVN